MDSISEQEKEHSSEMACGPRIFVVDDERLVASTLNLILRQAGYDSEAFFDPTAVLAAVSEAVPDLIISDIVMPQMIGIDLAIQLRDEHPACKVILFSGQAATSELLEDARARGHEFSVLAKPLHPTTLLSHVRASFGQGAESA